MGYKVVSEKGVRAIRYKQNLKIRSGQNKKINRGNKEVNQKLRMTLQDSSVKEVSKKKDSTSEKRLGQRR